MGAYEALAACYLTNFIKVCVKLISITKIKLKLVFNIKFQQYSLQYHQLF